MEKSAKLKTHSIRRKSSQTIGFELEFYTNKSIQGIRSYLLSNGLTNLEVTNDQSLHDYYDNDGDYMQGSEIRTNIPLKWSQSTSTISDLCSIMKDSSLKPTVQDDMDRGSTGIHVHFGLPRQLNTSLIDMLRLLRNVHDNEEKIERLAKRDCCRWAKSMSQVISEIDDSLRTLNNSGRSQESFRRIISRMSKSSIARAIQSTIPYGPEYQSFRGKFFRISHIIKNLLFASNGFSQIDDKYTRSNQEKYYISNFGSSSEIISLNGSPISIESIGDENTKYLIIREVEESTPNAKKYSEIKPLLDNLKTFCSQRRSRLFMNKYINKFQEIDLLLNELYPILGLPDRYFNFSTDFNMESIRLMYDINNDHVIEAAIRLEENNDFTQKILRESGTPIRRRSLSTLETNWFTELRGYHYDDNRYYGVNATSIGDPIPGGRSKHNTVEFRWASTSLALNEKAFREYVHYLEKLVDISFTGEREMKWGNYILRDITDPSKKNLVTGKRDSHILAVYVENQFIGRIYCDKLSSKITKPNNKKIDSYMMHYSIGSSSDKQHITKLISEQIKSHLFFVNKSKKAIAKANFDIKMNQDGRKARRLERIKTEIITASRKKDGRKIEKYLSSN